MAKRIDFTGEQRSEIRRKFHKGRTRKNVFGYRRLQVLYLRSKGKTNKEIAEICDYNEKRITELVNEYRNFGMDAILNDKRTSNNRRLSEEAEKAFLEQFREEAEAGLIVTVNGILEKYEELTGKKSNTQTIYKLLKRHGWRKVKPRPRHPGKASEAEIEASKKLTLSGKKSYWKNM